MPNEQVIILRCPKCKRRGNWLQRADRYCYNCIVDYAEFVELERVEEMAGDIPGMPEPQTPLLESTAEIHEWFMSLIAGGFTEEQALRIVIGVLTAKLSKDDND